MGTWGVLANKPATPSEASDQDQDNGPAAAMPCATEDSLIDVDITATASADADQSKARRSRLAMIAAFLVVLSPVYGDGRQAFVIAFVFLIIASAYTDTALKMAVVLSMFFVSVGTIAMTMHSPRLARLYNMPYLREHGFVNGHFNGLYDLCRLALVLLLVLLLSYTCYRSRRQALLEGRLAYIAVKGSSGRFSRGLSEPSSPTSCIVLSIDGQTTAASMASSRATREAASLLNAASDAWRSMWGPACRPPRARVAALFNAAPGSPCFVPSSLRVHLPPSIIWDGPAGDENGAPDIAKAV